MDPEPKAMRAISQAAGTAARRQTSRARVMIAMTLVLLLAQFLLGMYLNIFVPNPGRQPVVVAHIGLGTLLLLIALVTAGVAIAGRRPVTAVLTAAGLVFLVVAWIGGARFVAGGRHDSDSYLMAIGFILAATSYVAALDVGRRDGA